MRLWGAHLLGLLCVGIAVGMGVWQYDAFQQRRAAERLDLTHADPVAFADVLGPDDPFPAKDVGRPVDVAGTWLPEGTVLIAGRAGEDEHAGEDGRWVVTPLTVGGPDEPAVPVVRGWVPAGTDLADLGPAPTGEAEVHGWVQPVEGTGETDDDPSDDVLPQLRTADLVQRVDVDLYGAYVIAEETTTADTAAGIVPASLDQLPPASRFTGLRNVLYAVEWWVFAAFAAFIWFRHVRDTTREPEPGQPDGGTGEDDAVPSTA
ncbi:SURF1 family protein [Nocardioides caeni]